MGQAGFFANSSGILAEKGYRTRSSASTAISESYREPSVEDYTSSELPESSVDNYESSEPYDDTSEPSTSKEFLSGDLCRICLGKAVPRPGQINSKNKKISKNYKFSKNLEFSKIINFQRNRKFQKNSKLPKL